MLFKRFSWVSHLLLAALFTAAALAQGERATVTGTVTDPSGAIAIGAAVSIRNIGTNVVTRTKTNSAGIYYLSSLPAGRYELRVEVPGFRPTVVENIPLGPGLTATFDVTLQVGPVTEAVEVTATAVQLEAQTTALGKIIETRSITELPVLGRDPTQLVTLLPGVSPEGGSTTGSGTNVKISGGLATANGLLTDGGESRGTVRTDQANVIPLESVAEVRVETATYASEFGRSGGGVISMVTKSGTNQFHGVLYEFLRNDHLNANSWQNNQSSLGKGLLQWNQFGAAVGGPIVHNRTFFFANYEGNRQRTPYQFLSTVPTPEQDLGNLSSTLNGSGAQTMIYDPLTTRADPSRPGNYIRDAFPGNRIPQSRIHPITQNVLKYWPAPNRPGQGPAQFNNYLLSAKTALDLNGWVMRIDHTISDKHRLFGRFNGWQSTTLYPGLTDANTAFPSLSSSSNPTRTALISLTSTFSPSLIGELRTSYNRLMSNSIPLSEGFDSSKLGFQPAFTNAMDYKSFPLIYVQQYVTGAGLSIVRGGSDIVGNLGANGKARNSQDTWQLQFQVTYLRNRHKVKVGADLELLRLFSYSSQYDSGRFFFDNAYTQGPDPAQASANGGSGFASLLLGIPDAGNLTLSPPLSLYQRYYAFYFQDDIQLTSKLTANLGMRYEYTTPWKEKLARIGYLDGAATESVTGAKGTFKFLQPGQYLTDPNRKNFGPRVGLAYRLTSKTVIRAAGAIFYAPTNTINPGTSDWGNGMYVANDLSLGPPNPLPNTPPIGGSWSNPFAGGLLTPDRSTTFAGQNVRTFIRRYNLPYVSNWTFNIQRMLTPTMVVQAGYVGSKTTHASQNRQYNQNNPSELSLGPQLLQTVANPYFGKILTGSLSYPTIQLRQLLRPFPQYLDVFIARDGYGDANYEAFQLQINKQFSHGVSFTVGYTNSKSIINNFESSTGQRGTEDALYAPNFSRGLEPNDISQRLILSYSWELPFGAGRAHLSKGLLSQIVGRWQLSGITAIQRGIPLAILAQDTTNLYNFALQSGRPNRVKDPVLPSDQQTMDRYFDTTAFAAAPAYTLPNGSVTEPRLRDPGRRNFDVSLSRNQEFRERYNLQFRAEFFNLSNTPQLSLGTTSSVTLNAPQFGKVLSGTSPRNVQLGLRMVF